MIQKILTCLAFTASIPLNAGVTFSSMQKISHSKFLEELDNFDAQKQFDEFIKNAENSIQHPATLEKEVFKIWDTLQDQTHLFFSEDLFKNLERFIKQGAIPLDYYEIHMMSTIQDFLQNNQLSIDKVNLQIGSTRSETWAQSPQVHTKLTSRMNIPIKSELLESYSKAIEKTYDGSASQIFKQWFEKLDNSVYYNDRGIFWSHNPLLEQKISSSIAELDFESSWKQSFEAYCLQSLFQFICVQCTLKTEFDFASVMDMAGRRLPLITTLFVHKTWIEILRNSQHAQQRYGQFIVSSIAITAFEIWAKHTEEPDVWKNTGTFGHKGVSFWITIIPF